MGFPKSLIFAEDSEVKRDVAKCAGVGYSGGPISQDWSDRPVYVDISGMEIAPQVCLMYSHMYSPGYRLGVCDVKKEDGKLMFSAEMDTSTEIGKGMAASGRMWSWQASIGAENLEFEEVKDGVKAQVNGREVEGPAYIVRKSLLREISLVALGADPEAYMDIAAALSLAASKPKKEDGNMAGENTAENTQGKVPENTQGKAPEKNSDISARLENLENENKKLQAQLDRVTPMIQGKGEEGLAKGKVLEAAFELSNGIKPDCSERILEAASKPEMRDMGIKKLIFMAAKENGWTGSYLGNSDIESALHYTTAAYSNVSLGGILGNAINKKIREGWNYAEGAWRKIARVVSVNNFLAYDSYRLTVDGEFELVPKNGQLNHGGLGEESYSNKARTYGKMFTIDRVDIVNDNMGAINQRALQFGRMAAVKLNKVFWTTFLNNGSFFSSTNGNIKTSAGVLSLANLAAVDGVFGALKDETGPIGIMPAILLEPRSLRLTGESICNDIEIRDNTANKSYGTRNPFAGKLENVSSAYLEDSTIANSSADDYYLLADPNVAAVMEVCFLDGREQPIVEYSSTDFDCLGIRFRGYFDFGCTLADPKAGVKADKQ